MRYLLAVLVLASAGCKQDEILQQRLADDARRFGEACMKLGGIPNRDVWGKYVCEFPKAQPERPGATR